MKTTLNLEKEIEDWKYLLEKWSASLASIGEAGVKDILNRKQETGAGYWEPFFDHYLNLILESSVAEDEEFCTQLVLELIDWASQFSEGLQDKYISG